MFIKREKIGLIRSTKELVKFSLAEAGFPFPLGSFVKSAEWLKRHHGKPDVTFSLFYSRGVLPGYHRKQKAKVIE